jgi:hypothetical protein
MIAPFALSYCYYTHMNTCYGMVDVDMWYVVLVDGEWQQQN